MQERDDHTLIADYLEGDKSAIALLLQRHLKHVYNFAVRLSGDPLMAEDIAQETFVKVWRNLKKYRKGENFTTWLFAIARNTTIDHLRKKRSVPFSYFEKEEGENFVVENFADDSPTPEELFILREQKELVDTLLQKVSPAQREVLILHEGENMTFDEIGKILNKPLNTVKSQHRRALIELRKIMNEYGE